MSASITLPGCSVFYCLQVSNLLQFLKKNPEEEANLRMPFHTPLSGTLSHCSSLNVSEQVLHPCKKFINLLLLLSMFQILQF